MVASKSLPSPGWLYRFLAWVEATPLKGILLTAGLLLLGVFLNHLPYWQTGLLKPGSLDSQLLFEATWFPINILVWLAIDRVALTAVTNFAKGIGKGDREVRSIYNDFISVPWSTILVLLALFLGLGQAIVAAQAAGLESPGWIAVASLWPALGAVFELMAIVRIVRQLFVVNQLYKEVTKINLFNLWPVYALSRYGYTLAFYFILATVIIYVVIIPLSGSGFSLGQVIYSVLLSILIFIGPLFGINARLRREKELELQRLGVHINGIYDEIETAVRRRKLNRVNELRTAATAIREQMESIQKVATWPWNPGSVRNLLLPILLPLFVAVLQRYVLSALGF
jgi:hypothetical protein